MTMHDESDYIYQKWLNEGQKAELDFHIKNEWRRSPDFMENTKLLFLGFGFSRNQFANKTILDMGAGSKLRTLYFADAKIIALEPLADDYLNKVEYSDLKKADEVYSLPAEDFIPELVERVDFCISINVLDHCYNFQKVCQNIYKYLKHGGTAFLSFDSHALTNPSHPLFIRYNECFNTLFDCGFVIEKFSQGFPDIYLNYKNVKTYGHGEICLNYWLRKI